MAAGATAAKTAPRKPAAKTGASAREPNGATNGAPSGKPKLATSAAPSGKSNQAAKGMRLRKSNGATTGALPGNSAGEISGAAQARQRKAAASRAPGPLRKAGVREQAAQATRDSILRAATKVFAKHGFAGGRVEQISSAARSYDRMIYYYFGSKEALFIAVLEEMYRRFNEAESRLVLDAAQPVAALKAVIRFMWGYYQKNPEFITLLNTENLHRGKHIAKSLRAADYSSPAIAVLAGVLQQGAAQRLFRSDVAARDVYLMIAGMAYFYLSNRFTLAAFLGEPLETPEALAHWEGFLIDAVLRAVSAGTPRAQA